MRLPTLRNIERTVTRVTSSSPWVVSILASTAAVGLVSLVGGDSPVRHVVALWFLFTCPGMALVPLLEIDDPVFEWSLIVATSLAVDAIVAVAMVYADVWSPMSGLLVIMLLTLLGALVQSILPAYRESTRKR